MSKEILHIYTRVSSDSQEDNTSLKSQEKNGILVAEQKNFNHKIWNEGVGSSSKETLENRPVLSELLAECANGNVNHLYAEYTDRLSRNQSTWSAIRLTLRKNKILLYTGRSPEPIDLQDPTDDLLFGILSEVSIFDNRIRTRRMTTGRSKRISEGKWHGGPPPYGYSLNNQQLTINEDEAHWVRQIFQDYIDLKSIDKIRDKLMMNGVKTRRGNAVWSHGSIDALLKNTHYSGSYTVHIKQLDETHQVSCPKIVDDEIYEKVNELKRIRSTGQRLKQPNEKYFYLLRGLMKCGHCGLELTGKKNKEQKRDHYYCPIVERKFRLKNTPKEKLIHKVISLKIDDTDEIVWDTVLSVIENSVIFKETAKTESLSRNSLKQTDHEVTQKVQQKKKCEKEFNKLSTAIGSLNAIYALEEDQDTLNTIENLKKKRTEIESEISEINHEIQVLMSQGEWIDWLKEFSERIDTLKKEKDDKIKRRFLDGVVERIDVYTAMNESAEHELMIHFKLPYVNDSLKYVDESKKSLGYEVKNGKTNKRVVLNTKKKVS